MGPVSECPGPLPGLDRTGTIQPMGELGELIEQWRSKQPYRPSDRKMAERLGVSPSTIGDWIRGTVPGPEKLAALAAEMHYPYRRLLDAVMVDLGYLPEPGVERSPVTEAAQ